MSRPRRELGSDGVTAAVSAAGGVRKLGRLLGISSQAISQWDCVPADRVVAVEQATGVPRERLRPDLYRQPAGGLVDGTVCAAG